MIFRCVWESCSYHKNSKNTKASSPFQIASIICSNQRKINLVRVVTSINHSKLSAYLPPHPILNWWVKHQSTFWTRESKSFMYYTNKISLSYSKLEIKLSSWMKKPFYWKMLISLIQHENQCLMLIGCIGWQTKSLSS